MKKIINNFASLNILQKGVGSGAGSGAGSDSRRYGSADPYPHKNVTDPQHWLCERSLLTNLTDNGSPRELMLLAEHLHVPQLPEVEVPLLLQPLHSQLHLHHLQHTPINQSGAASQAARPMRDPQTLRFISITSSTPINQSGAPPQAARPMREPARKWTLYYDCKL